MLSKEDKKEYQRIKKELRKAFLFSAVRRAFLKAMRVPNSGSLPFISRKVRYLYQCNYCRIILSAAAVEIDHIKGMEKLGDDNECLTDALVELVRRMFDPNNLQILCKSCHANKFRPIIIGEVKDTVGDNKK